MTHKFILNSRPRKNGNYTILLLLLDQAARQSFKIDSIEVAKVDWDSSKGCVKLKACNSQRINRLLSEIRNKIETYLYNCTLNKQIPSFNEIEKALFANRKTCDFYSFMESEIINSIDFCEATKRAYLAKISKFKRFSPTLNLHEINHAWIDKYVKHCINVEKNKHNTWTKDIITIKAFLNRALSKEIIEKHPLTGYKTTEKEGNKNYLTIEELQKLTSLYQKESLPNHLQNILKIFIFSCYTGLRYQDLKDLIYENINDGFISIKQHKTQDYLTVPIMSVARDLISIKEVHNPKDHILDVPTNQHMNRGLKEIIQLVGIPKLITCHCARHTFATVAIINQVPLTFVQKLLGHRDYNTTLLYTKIANPALKSEIDKLNEVFK